jgi:hypothetical protein
MKNDLITLGELRAMLNAYPDDYYVSFGDRYLAKVDDHDTDVVMFQWITQEEHDYLRGR